MARSTLGPFGFVATSMACAVSLGLLIITATVLGVDALRAQSGAADLDQSFYLLIVGTLGGILLAGYAGWRLLDLIPSTYRRGALSLVCGFATVLLMLICIPVHQLLGRTGLYFLLGACGVVAALLGRRAASARING
ncbi:MAG TPA: hypothetical protein VFX42_06640 [Gemmatimonadales bacterium]|nr:hypothetical protein [Gemmatimonadales bacterium]